MIVTLPFTIEVEVPEGWTEHDIADVVCFHLNTTDLTSTDVDFSACTIRSVHLLRGLAHELVEIAHVHGKEPTP